MVAALVPGVTMRMRWLAESATNTEVPNHSSPACGCSIALVPGPSANPMPPATSVVMVCAGSQPITFSFPVELARKNTRPSGEGATATAVG